MTKATLCFLIRGISGRQEILLAMKRKGFGAGKWNGVGGKFDSQKGDKNIIDTAIRETEEEIGVLIKNPEKVAILRFHFPYIEDKQWDQDVHVFLCRDWRGIPRESDEMFPRWFNAKTPPFNEMWDDDKIWLPHIIEGRKFMAKFFFSKGEKVIENKFDLLAV